MDGVGRGRVECIVACSEEGVWRGMTKRGTREKMEREDGGENRSQSVEKKKKNGADGNNGCVGVRVQWRVCGKG